MEYFARKYDPENEAFWKICGLLHDLDWEKWQDAVQHTVKTAELLQEAGVSPMVAHVIETHNSDNNPALPKPQHQMAGPESQVREEEVQGQALCGRL